MTGSMAFYTQCCWVHFHLVSYFHLFRFIFIFVCVFCVVDFLFVRSEM